MELNIEKFSPSVAELKKLVSQTSSITASDLTDKSQLKVVKENRIQLRDVRVAIEKTGKALRADALTFQKAVITKEKELIAIVEPEEVRLKEIEEKAEELAELERRKETLPRRLEVLMGAGIELSEAEILSMDDNQFIEFKNLKLQEKNEAEKQKLEAERQAIEAEKLRLEREKELRAVEEKARLEERARAEQDIKDREAKRIQDEKDREEREKQEKKDAEIRIAQEKEETERKEREAKERLDGEKKYQKFKAKNGFTEATKLDFKEERVGQEIVLWKKVGVFKLGKGQ